MIATCKMSQMWSWSIGTCRKVYKYQNLKDDVKIVEDKLEKDILLATSYITTNKYTKCYLIVMV